MKICAMDINGIAQCTELHHLKPHIYIPCHLKNNIPAGCFSDSDAISPGEPLLIGPNPVDIEKPKGEIGTVIILRQINLDRSTQCLKPFLVTRCVPSDPALEFYAVLCHSQPSRTVQLVEKALSNKPLPLPLDKPGFSFGFWTLTRCGTNYVEFKLSSSNGLKQGNTVSFSGSDLPSGITSGCRYIVKSTTNWSFDVCGPIVCPATPFAPEAFSPDDSSFYIVKRSPVGRYETHCNMKASCITCISHALAH